MTRITTEAELVEVIGNTVPGLEAKVLDHVDDFAVRFIEKSPFAVLSTADGEGRVDASPKGDGPGFISVLDRNTIVIPDRPGNKLAFGHRNILQNPQIGVLLMLPGTPETLRINGKAEISADPELLEALAARGKPAVLAIRITVEECFFHCGKAFLRSGLWKPDTWGERHRISFGQMFAARQGGDQELADGVDAMIDQDYRDNL